MKKLLVLLLSASFLISCSSDSPSSSKNDEVATSPMMATIDGQLFEMQPEEGGDSSDPSGGQFGSYYHMLEGYKLSSGTAINARLPIPEYKYFIRLAIPEADISEGAHYFTSTHIPNGYFADLEISQNTDAGEDEVIINGKIVVESYDFTTRRIKGTFDFTTNNGEAASQTHDVSGTFNYILAVE